VSTLVAEDLLGRVLRAHADEVDPLLGRAAAAGASSDDVRAALGELAQVAPQLLGAPGAAPGSSDEGRVLLPAVTAVLDLVARGRWRAGHPQHYAVLATLPAVWRWVRAAPDVTTPAVVAAADVVARAGRAQAWTALLTATPAPSPDDVRPALAVAAWRAGLARYRDAALAAAADLPPDVAGPLLRLAPVDVHAVLERHRTDRWWWVGAPEGPGVVSRVGGFRPWGGRWTALPRVVPGGGSGWTVVADGGAWRVVADVHGAAFVATDESGLADLPVPTSGPTLAVPWTDHVTGWAPAADAPDVVLVSRAHSYVLDVVRVADR